MQLTPHLTDATLATALDRDRGATAEAVRLHVMDCEACRRALAVAEADDAEAGRLFGSLDHTPPEIDAAEFVRGLTSRGNARKTVLTWSRSWPRNAARWTVAAGILTASVVAAALVPNSPVRQLIRLVAAASPVGHNHSSAARSGSSAGQSPLPRGVEILPDGRAEVLFRSRQAAGAVRVITTTTPQLSVEGDGDGPTYTVGENTIIVNNRPSDSVNYTVLVPTITDAAAVYIRIAGRVAYSHVGNRVTAQVPAESSGQLLLPLQNAQR